MDERDREARNKVMIVINVMLFFVVLCIIVTMPECRGCIYTNGDERIIGNCSELEPIINPYLEQPPKELQTTVYREPEPCNCPKCHVCPKCQVCLPKTICPKCLPITENQKKELLGLRCKYSEAPIFQHGYSNCRRDVIEILGLKK